MDICVIRVCMDVPCLCDSVLMGACACVECVCVCASSETSLLFNKGVCSVSCQLPDSQSDPRPDGEGGPPLPSVVSLTFASHHHLHIILVSLRRHFQTK